MLTGESVSFEGEFLRPELSEMGALQGLQEQLFITFPGFPVCLQVDICLHQGRQAEPLPPLLQVRKPDVISVLIAILHTTNRSWSTHYHLRFADTRKREEFPFSSRSGFRSRNDTEWGGIGSETIRIWLSPGWQFWMAYNKTEV